MSKFLFGQSYYLRFDAKLYAEMKPYPPLGSLYAASYARALGYDVALFDAMLAPSEDEWAHALETHQPKYAILFEDNFNYLSKMCLLNMRAAAFKMMEMAKARGCVVIVNGSDATDHLDDYFAHGADYILLGEGEVTLGELLGALEKNEKREYESIRGLGWRDDNGNIQRAPKREFIRDLDRLPFPAWDLVDIARYQKIWRERHGYYSMNMVTTRGCPYSCNWCAKPIYGQRYNVRSPENVAQELRWLREHFQPDHIWFADDIFGLKPGWLGRFADLVNAYDCATPFKCLLRADLVTPQIANALQRAKCHTVWIGAESGSQKILDAMDKGATVEQIYTARKLLGDAGIRVGYFIQYGYRGETRADIELTLKMIRETVPDEIGISVSYPLPGTKFYENVRAELGAKQNWTDSDDLAMMYQGTYSTDFYRILYRVTHHELRRLHAERKLKRALRAPQTIRGDTIRALGAIPLQTLRLARARNELNARERQAREPIRLSPEAL
ncbi:MAG: B12-binding domain-containing radical SAM protein [Chloroflexi bacterium]|nr:B12-binding domain-containing radical SAM protein [Chloroflexota bacterium]